MSKQLCVVTDISSVAWKKVLINEMRRQLQQFYVYPQNTYTLVA